MMICSDQLATGVLNIPEGLSLGCLAGLGWWCVSSGFGRLTEAGVFTSPDHTMSLLILRLWWLADQQKAVLSNSIGVVIGTRIPSRGESSDSEFCFGCVGTLNELVLEMMSSHEDLPMLKMDNDLCVTSCVARYKKQESIHPLKSAGNNHQYPENTNTEVLHTLHMDLCGPMRTESINGKKYVLVIVDDYTRFGWVRFLQTKDETPHAIKKFIVKTQRALNATVCFVRTDNGTEFVNTTLDGWFESVGISHETSVPRSPQQNGVVERRNRTIMEAARTMLIFAKAPLFLWAEGKLLSCISWRQNTNWLTFLRRHYRESASPHYSHCLELNKCHQRL
ncbi:retrovirus-related pol polyprotein from transposon TNT 1-94 [Tanacetum coccineum]